MPRRESGLLFILCQRVTINNPMTLNGFNGFLGQKTKGVLAAAAILAAAGLLSRLLGFLRNALLAYFYGAGDVLDAYFLAFRRSLKPAALDYGTWAQKRAGVRNSGASGFSKPPPLSGGGFFVPALEVTSRAGFDGRIKIM